ncbi:Hypothetical_protein [Hexamita inflata]|uniref:Hypothetical_protein n=1 Tax=Hexamita inflata TaxID=28002 RepID=A0AA86V221_9EUKA|nr:Hypothetical protein HINF_LOCUS60901 [Hexamita inflata]
MQNSQQVKTIDKQLQIDMNNLPIQKLITIEIQSPQEYYTQQFNRLQIQLKIIIICTRKQVQTTIFGLKKLLKRLNTLDANYNVIVDNPNLVRGYLLAEVTLDCSTPWSNSQ